MSRRRTLLLTLGLVAGVLALAAGGMIYAAKREPSFYARNHCSGDWDSRMKAGRLVTRVQDLKNDIRSKSEWGDTFTADDLNCFFAETMCRKGGLCAMLPNGFHSPRVAIDGD